MASFFKSLARGAERGAQNYVAGRGRREARQDRIDQVDENKRRYEEQQQQNKLRTMLGVMSSDIDRASEQLDTISGTPGISYEADVRPFEVKLQEKIQARNSLLSRMGMGGQPSQVTAGSMPPITVDRSATGQPSPNPINTLPAKPEGGVQTTTNAIEPDVPTVGPTEAINPVPSPMERIFRLRQEAREQKAISTGQNRASYMVTHDSRSVDGAMNYVRSMAGGELSPDGELQARGIFEPMRAAKKNEQIEENMDQLLVDFNKSSDLAESMGGRVAYNQWMAKVKFAQKNSGIDPVQAQMLGAQLLQINPAMKITGDQASRLTELEVQQSMAQNALDSWVDPQGNIRPEIQRAFGVVAGSWTEIERKLAGGQLTPEASEAWWSVNFLVEKMGRSLTGAAIQDWERDFFKKLFGDTTASPETTKRTLQSFLVQTKVEKEAVWRAVKNIHERKKPEVPDSVLYEIDPDDLLLDVNEAIEEEQKDE